MQNELIHAASKLFPTFEHWQSFLELSNNREAIMEHWYVEATSKIRHHFRESLPPESEWAYEAWGNRDLDTRWFLKEFGPDSIFVSYGWRYELHLTHHNNPKFNAQFVSSLIQKNDYRPIQQAFDRIDERLNGAELREVRNFKFGTAHDGNYSDYDLAWHAAHQMDLFVDQAIAKIEKFTNNPEVTKLLRQLNQTALSPCSTPKLGS